MKTKKYFFFLSLLLLAAAAQGCYSPTRELQLTTVAFPDVSLPNPTLKHQGTLSLHVIDTRQEKPKVGKLGGRIGANSILVIYGGLEPRLETIMADALARAGYSIVPDVQPTLETEVAEFRVYANGWTQGAKESFRFRLRDKNGRVLWEKTVTGQDAFAEKSMNVALTRLRAKI
jgi:hypothetical protein